MAGEKEPITDVKWKEVEWMEKQPYFKLLLLSLLMASWQVVLQSYSYMNVQLSCLVDSLEMLPAIYLQLTPVVRAWHSFAAILPLVLALNIAKKPEQ